MPSGKRKNPISGVIPIEGGGYVLTSGSISRVCGVAPRTVSKWIDQGILKGYRIPGSLDRRVNLEDLYAFLKKHNLPITKTVMEFIQRDIVIFGNYGRAQQIIIEELEHRKLKIHEVRDIFSLAKLIPSHPIRSVFVGVQESVFTQCEIGKRLKLELPRARLVAIEPEDMKINDLRSIYDDVFESEHLTESIVNVLIEGKAK